MTPQETALVTTLLERLKATGGQLKDPEAEALIRQTTAEQADAAYYLAQTVVIQDLSLHTAQYRIAELEKNLEDAKAALPPPSFLGGLWGASQRANPVPAAALSSPAGAAPPPNSAAAEAGNPTTPASAAGSIGGEGAGGFLRAAAVTAAGVAGGALLFEGIQSMFGHHDAVGIIGDQTPIAGPGQTGISNEPPHSDTANGQGPPAASPVDAPAKSGVVALAA
jgi:hypothetical protein